MISNGVSNSLNKEEMAVAETIEQFVSNLEQNFDPNDLIDFNIATLRYVKLIPKNELVVRGTCGSEWVTVDKEWDVLCIGNGDTQISEVIRILKTYLPKNKDATLIMSKDGSWFGISSSKFVTTKKFLLDEHGSYVLTHPKIIEHNQPYLYKEFWTKFTGRMTEYCKVEKDHKSILKFARFLVTDYRLTSSIKIDTLYFYSNSFFSSFDDVLKTHPDAKDVKFVLFKDAMVPETLIPQKNVSKEKRYVINSASFTLKEVLDKYELTELQIIKFFVVDGTNFKCLHPEILEKFEK